MTGALLAAMVAAKPARDLNRSVPAATREEAARAFCDGATKTALARRYDVSEELVSRRIDEAAVIEVML